MSGTLLVVLALLAMMPAMAAPAAPVPRQAGDVRVFPVGGGTPVRLDDLRGEWVALHFLLEVDCSFCRMHLRTYAQMAPMHPEVRHLFIKAGDAAALESWQASLHLPEGAALGGDGFEVLYRDPNGTLARHMHIPHGYEYQGGLIRFPAFVLIDPEGTEAFRHVGAHTGDRFGFDRFAQVMESIQRPFRLEALPLPEGSMVALGGFDPVAYFVEGRPIEGDPAIWVDYHGLVVRFVSESHRAVFEGNPRRYLPAYGGWCALAMSTGRTVEGDPTHFVVHAGRLYFFNRGVFTNARGIWQRDPGAYISGADGHWERIGGERPLAE